MSRASSGEMTTEVFVQVLRQQPDVQPVKEPGLQASAIHKAAAAFDTAVATCDKLGKSWAPWKSAKNKTRAQAAAQAINDQRTNLMKMLGASLNRVALLEIENMKAVEQVADHVKLQGQQKASVELILKLRGEIDALSKSKTDGATVTRELLNRVEEVVPGPKRYLKVDGEKETLLLHDRLETLLKEHDKLRAEHDNMARSNLALEKKIKEQCNKERDDKDVRDREVRRLTTELAHAKAGNASAVAAAKAESAAELAKRGAEAKSLRSRLELLKTELEGAKRVDKTLKLQADEAMATAAKAAEEAKAAGRRAAAAGANRDEVALALNATRTELGLVAAQYQQVVHALVAVSGPAALPNSANLCDMSRPWPRQAFTSKDSHMLHSRACGQAHGTAATVLEYASATELQALLAQGHLMCCSACKGGF